MNATPILFLFAALLLGFAIGWWIKRGLDQRRFSRLEKMWKINFFSQESRIRQLRRLGERDDSEEATDPNHAHDIP
ncbi:MAG TPA: hypothetical protein PKN04_11510 [bacterium]|jgi:hypothetical protein|nr:hypothetical protein [bacterium]HNT66397.1 hypothetical protein [bacterium]HOX87625.1 hypothetical protein [bacterium]HPG47303.1 hypothetical protein [bacterium]HPM99603.1 hypothetical protein [bacterium]